MTETSGGTPAYHQREAAHSKKGSRDQSHQSDRTCGGLAMLAFRQGENQTLQAHFSSVLNRV